MDGDGFVVLFRQRIKRCESFFVNVEMAIARIELDADALPALEVFLDERDLLLWRAFLAQGVKTDAIAEKSRVVMLLWLKALVPHDNAMHDAETLIGVLQMLCCIFMPCSKGDLIKVIFLAKVQVRIYDFHKVYPFA